MLAERELTARPTSFFDFEDGGLATVYALARDGRA